jgi:hypothetical protein
VLHEHLHHTQVAKLAADHDERLAGIMPAIGLGAIAEEEGRHFLMPPFNSVPQGRLAT